MTSLRRLTTALIAAGLLTLGIAGPAAAAGTRDNPDDIKSGESTTQKATAVEYGLIVGLIAVA